jgi:glutaconyl-CoA/methylmalonyl-CoA decarboxylase subunit gamma
MRYFVSLDPTPSVKPILVDVTELSNGDLDVHVDGRAVTVDFVPVGPSLSVRVDGHMVDLTTEGVPPELGAVASGTRAYVRVESERERVANAARKGGAAGGDKVLKSPMPGRVLKVLVAEGDEVELGQSLLVVEAMKMENEVKSKAKGTVIAVHVVAGATVEGNAKLITLS